MNAYVIQEFSLLDNKWHNICLSSSSNGIYTDEDHARYVYELFKKANANPNHLRMITCKLTIVKAECGDCVADFRKKALAYQKVN